MGQGLTIGVDDSNSQLLCKADIKWLFSKRRGNKTIQVDDSRSIHVHWDLSSSRFGSGPEPLEGFYLAIVFDMKIILLLGDLDKEALRNTGSPSAPNGAVLASKREHLYGKKVFFTKAKFCNNGQVHDLIIECDIISTTDPCLIIRVDRKNVVQVKRLKWKFRGNHSFLVDGIPVEVFWDVHNWLFSSTSSVGNAVFMFKTCPSADKLWSSQSLADPNMLSWSHSRKIKDFESHNLGFSLVLYAWKQE